MGGKLMSGRVASSKWITGLAVAALASLGAGQAMAGCSSPGGGAHSPPNWHDLRGGLPASDAIVGFWNVTFTSDGTSYPTNFAVGFELDFGTVQWHDDGTEIMVSGGRDPSTGDVCMGVWKRSGVRTFKLNHLGLAWAGGAFLGPAVFHETVTLDRSGNTYEGPFTIDQYASDGVTLLEHLGGTVKGTRITAD